MILQVQDQTLEPNKPTVATRLGPNTTPINLCARCSSALLNAKTNPSERLTDWACSLCRLGEDCAVPENGSFEKVAYVDHEGPTGLLLAMGFKGYQRTHPLKMISCKHNSIGFSLRQVMKWRLCVQYIVLVL
jgi:hypothetical protein